MKIRCGFISNSSSSSFVIYGTEFNEGEMKSRYGFTDEDFECIYEEGIYEYEDRIIEKESALKDLAILYDGENGQLIIGKELYHNYSGQKIIETINSVNEILGEKNCTLYRGVDCDGELAFDD